MEKEYQILGKELAPEKEREIEERLKKLRKEGMEPLENEMEKSAEEIKAIEKINELINQEFENLSIEKEVDIKPEQIHLFPNEKEFLKVFPGESSPAFHELDRIAIYILKSYFEKAQLYSVILHESIHIASIHKFYKEEQKREGVQRRRLGYQNFGFKNKETIKQFRGFNEGIVELTTMEILKNHKDDLMKEFDINPEKLKTFKFGYQLEMKIINTIIEKVAENNDEPPESVWTRFKKGQFTGEMMHLRDIERTFGANALRLLAFLGAKELNTIQENRMNNNILKYFETDNEDEQNKIINEILNN